MKCIFHSQKKDAKIYALKSLNSMSLFKCEAGFSLRDPVLRFKEECRRRQKETDAPRQVKII